MMSSQQKAKIIKATRQLRKMRKRLRDQAPDVILEAKAKDVAVMQLRSDLVRYARDLAAIFGLGVAT